ncbi:hypothetical protein M0R04_10020 [Candidatus Dojkabacteria bacterium]|jgi:hypothetical protein|nr:hypothetical protein [Candidatus Dojkabacteria bacterium]
MTKQTNSVESQFAGMEEAKKGIIKFGKVGDWFKGTLTDNTRFIENKLSAKHEMQQIFEFKTIGGSFHNIVKKIVDSEATIPTPGEFYSFFAQGFMKDQLKNAKVGQIIALHFAEERPAKQPGYNDTKIVKVYFGDMDPEYHGETTPENAFPLD